MINPPTLTRRQRYKHRKRLTHRWERHTSTQTPLASLSFSISPTLTCTQDYRHRERLRHEWTTDTRTLATHRSIPCSPLLFTHTHTCRQDYRHRERLRHEFKTDTWTQTAHPFTLSSHSPSVFPIRWLLLYYNTFISFGQFRSFVLWRCVREQMIAWDTMLFLNETSIAVARNVLMWCSRAHPGPWPTRLK